MYSLNTFVYNAQALSSSRHCVTMATWLHFDTVEDYASTLGLFAFSLIKTVKLE